MKFIGLFILTLSFNAKAYLYSDFSRTYLSEIECLESLPTEIKCERIQNNLMMCRAEFQGLMKNSGLKNLNITHYEKINVDSKIFRPLTNGINELTAKSEARSEVKRRIKQLNDFKYCQE